MGEASLVAARMHLKEKIEPFMGKTWKEVKEVGACDSGGMLLPNDHIDTSSTHLQILQDKKLLSTIEDELGEQFPGCAKLTTATGQGKPRLWWKDVVQNYLQEGRKRIGECEEDIEVLIKYNKIDAVAHIA